MSTSKSCSTSWTVGDPFFEDRVRSLLEEDEDNPDDPDELSSSSDNDEMLQDSEVVDVYSDWCGPCVGMVGNLKKIKLDIGGDMLHLAIAKADGIGILKRFRDKSEPTWMFIGSGHLVNLMFGANAPRLTKLITVELAKEAAVLKGELQREALPFDELTPEERIRFEAAEKIRLAEQAAKEAAIARAKELAHQRLVRRLIRELKDYTIVVYLPFTFSTEENSWRAHIKVLEVLLPHGINVAEEYQKEMDAVTAWEMLYGNVDNITEEWKELLEKKTYNIKLMKRTKREPIVVSGLEIETSDEGMAPESKTDVIEEVVPELYGCPATEDEVKISPDSLSMLFSKSNIPGLWTPTSSSSKAEALIKLFPEFTKKYVDPEPDALPPHLLVVFKATVLEEIAESLPDYQLAILKMGIFEVNPPDNIYLVGRTLNDYFSLPIKSGKERFALVLDTTDADALLTLSQFMPIYISPSVEVGAGDSRCLFPPIIETGNVPSEPIENFPLHLLICLEGPPNLGKQGDSDDEMTGENEQDVPHDENHSKL